MRTHAPAPWDDEGSMHSVEYLSPIALRREVERAVRDEATGVQMLGVLRQITHEKTHQIYASAHDGQAEEASATPVKRGARDAKEDERAGSGAARDRAEVLASAMKPNAMRRTTPDVYAGKARVLPF